MSVSKNILAYRGAAVVAFGVYALIHSIGALYVFSSQPERVMSTGFGTARAPYSDALGPWLLGGLHALFGLPQIDYLYRPTIGWFWGSIIAITHRVDVIPLVFIGAWVLVVLTFLSLWRHTHLGLTLSLWIGYIALNLDSSFLPLSPMSLTVDLAALVFTTLGVFLLILVAQRQELMTLPSIVGGVTLGIAAAIRGPMIAGGVVFILCILWSHRKTGRRVIAITYLSFLAPIFLDAVLQRYYHVYSNGVISLFCVYSDIAHAWNGDCHRRFMELRPSLDSVIMDYVHFVGSSSGMAVLFVNFIGRVQQDVAAFSARSWGAVLFAVSTYAGSRLWSTKKTGEDAAEHWEVLRAHAVPLLALCVFWGFFLAARYSAVSKAYLALGLLLSCCAIAIKYKLWMPLSLFLAYSAACTFLTILGLAGYQRIALTFSFLFHIGAVLLIIRPFETTHESQERVSPHASSRLAWSVLFVVAGLYTCWAWWPSDWRTQFSHEVEGRDAAIKVSDDRALDRSLYFTGRHALVYTFSDTLPVGSVRRYIRLRDPTRSWNESFTHPNGFLEDEKDQ